MATISPLSAKGSPGVTTLTVALTMAWSTVHSGRRALAVDADPIGGDTAAGVLRGAVPTSAGILALATARGVDAHEALDSACVHLRADGSARVLPGVPDGARAAALPLAWDVLADLGADLHQSGTDVLVDAVVLIAPRGRRVVGGQRPDRPGCSAFPGGGHGRPSIRCRLAVRRGAAPPGGRGCRLALRACRGRQGGRRTPAGGPRLRPGERPGALRGANPARGFERSEYARTVRRVASDVGALAVARADLHLPAPHVGDAVVTPLAIEVHG